MTTVVPTPYAELNHILADLVARIQTVLQNNFIGFYLQGSFAVGDFDENSDCDFIVVTDHELSADEVDALQVVHAQIYDLDLHWAKHLEGSYFPKDMLRTTDDTGKPLWYLDHGSRSLIHDAHCNTVLVRWVVREYGVTLAGPPPNTLIDPIPVEMLRSRILTVMGEWAETLQSHPENYKNHFYQTYIVLQFCRMLHDLIRGCPGSKKAGAEWVKANLDPKWHGLIDRSWAGRYDPAVTVRTPADPDDFKATLEFVEYIINEANNRTLSP